MGCKESSTRTCSGELVSAVEFAHPTRGELCQETNQSVSVTRVVCIVELVYIWFKVEPDDDDDEKDVR